MRGPRSLTAAEQFLGLRTNPICAGCGHLRGGGLEWRYQTSPTPLSRDYSIRIAMRQGGSPDVFVDGPDLVNVAGGRRPPHLYEMRPARLCLHLPRAREWRPEMRLDQTVVPWTSLWLYHFERWLETGEWEGGGEHPAPHRRSRLDSWRRDGTRRQASPA